MRNYLSVLIAIVSIILIGTSCNIATTVHFNRDYSGNYSMDIDLSELMSMAMMFDSTGMSEEEMFAEMRSEMDNADLVKALNDIDGVSNAAMDFTEDGQIVWKFDFESVETLNTSFQKLNDAVMSGELLDLEGVEVTNEAGPDTPTASYTRKGKTITHRTDMDLGEMEGMMGEEEDGMMDMMMSMMDFTLEFTFDRKVKDVQLSGMDIIKQDAKLVRTRVDLKSAMDSGFYELSVKVK